MSTRVSTIGAAAALFGAMPAILYIVGNDTLAHSLGSTETGYLSHITNGFSEDGIQAAWYSLYVTIPALAFFGWTGMVGRRWPREWVPISILAGLAIAAFGVVGVVMLNFAHYALYSVPYVSLGLVAVWFTTLDPIREATATDAPVVRQRMQKRIDVALGVGALIVFVAPMIGLVVPPLWWLGI